MSKESNRVTLTVTIEEAIEHYLFNLEQIIRDIETHASSMRHQLHDINNIWSTDARQIHVRNARDNASNIRMLLNKFEATSKELQVFLK